MNTKRFKEPTYVDNKNLSYFLKEHYDLDLHHKKVIAAGAFGKIFKISTKDEQNFALKSFYTAFHYTKEDPDASFLRCKRAVEEYVNNIYRGYEEYKNEFLVQILNSKRNWPIATNSYVMEYVEGENIYSLISTKKLYDSKNYSKEDMGIILLNYAQMLKNLHDKNYLFLDVDWSSVFYDERNKKIIVTDIDSIAQINKINEVELREDPFEKGGTLIHRPSFVSFGKLMFRNRDFVKRTYEDENNLVNLTFNSELQSFAMMIDTLLNGSTFMESKFPKDGKFANWRLGEFLFRGKSLEQDIKYTQDRYKSIPKNLRVIVRDMFEPNPKQYVASDFISAIKEDYKL